MFEWKQCPRHPWLGVSVLVMPGVPTPQCYPYDGPAHVVHLSEPKVAA